MNLTINQILVALAFFVGFLLVILVTEIIGLIASIRRRYWARQSGRADQASAAAERHLANSRAALSEFDLECNSLHKQGTSDA